LSSGGRRGARGIFQLLRPYLARHVRALVVVLAIGWVAAFALRTPLLLLGPLWNQVLFPEKAVEASPPSAAELRFEQAFRFVHEHGMGQLIGAGADQDAQRIAYLWTVGALLSLIAFIAAVSQYSFHVLSRWIALNMVVELREDLARHLMRLSMRYHGSRRFGDVLSRMAEDVGQTLSVVGQSFKDLVLEPLMVVVSILVAATAAPELTGALLLLFIPTGLPFLFLGRRVRRRSKKSLATLGNSVQVLTEMLTGIRTVKAFRAEERELERYSEVNRDYMRASMRMERAVALTRGTTICLSHVGFAVLVVAVCWLSIRFELFTDAARMMQFFGGLALSYNHLRHVFNGWTKVQESSGAADRLRALFDEPEDITESPTPKLAPGLGSGIHFDNVTFTYTGGERAAIQDLSLALRPGETLALVGASGAGKSTFVDLLARFIDPDAGRILVDGIDLRELSLDSWTSHYAMVGQTPFLFHSSIRENIAYGKPGAGIEAIRAAAQAANIHDFILTLPQGYDTLVGDAGARLSGGQRQRITIARALLKEAPLLLLDEATSALDSESEQAVHEALERLMKGRTVVVIAHRLSTIRAAHRIAVLDEGRLVELGTHQELLARRGLYARFHEVQYGGIVSVAP